MNLRAHYKRSILNTSAFVLVIDSNAKKVYEISVSNESMPNWDGLFYDVKHTLFMMSLRISAYAEALFCNNPFAIKT